MTGDLKVALKNCLGTSAGRVALAWLETEWSV